ncbi:MULTISPECIES: GH25 family lysozyme [Vagococcus]|uniref:Phage-related lysozyme n=1 Tax=Vagococcus fluvialis bH819 TaxID=1255619 RepID=A0A1X6WKX6_9ENTE|nr:MULTISPECIES: GH25 family lysozyme [Vagococcus]SLM84892.1 Phage-related lysozyme [Vagococcus fluvialis bH819]HCM90432.1 hypothetical protein [Vagococcus sp.]
MLTIIDISNHQRGLALNSLSADTFIFKVTEGDYFKDDTLEDFIQQARSLDKPFGLYHFLDQSPVEEQANFFLSCITPYLGECLLVLDYEEYGRQGPDQAKRFLDIIYQKTQVKPLIYMNESDANAEDWSEVISADYGLWVAKYSSNLPKLSQWPNYAMWQYTSTPYDTSYFYGDLNAWKKYGLPETSNSTNYHLKGKRFKALKPLIIKADEWFKKDTGMFFSKSTVFDIQTICHTETTTHALIYYNHREVFVTLHKDYVELVE